MRTGPIISDARQLLQRQQAAQLAFRQGARDAPGPGLERRADVDAHHRTVPVRPAAGPVEVPGHSDHGQVPTAVGPTGCPVGVHRAQPALHGHRQGPVEDAAGQVDARRHMPARGPRYAGTAARLQRCEYLCSNITIVCGCTSKVGKECPSSHTFNVGESVFQKISLPK